MCHEKPFDKYGFFSYSETGDKVITYFVSVFPFTSMIAITKSIAKILESIKIGELERNWLILSWPDLNIIVFCCDIFFMISV